MPHGDRGRTSGPTPVPPTVPFGPLTRTKGPALTLYRNRPAWSGFRTGLLRDRPRTAPAATGSTRVLSPRRVDRHAQLLRRQARTAAAGGRPVAWLAALLYHLATERPRGASVNTGRVAAVLCASADWRSGRRARPGRQITADVLGLSERTVERQWRLLEALGVVVRTSDGRWLSAGERADVYADTDEANRWRDRQEWSLTLPAWVRDLPAALDMGPYEARARELLSLIAYRAQPGDLGVRSRVAPSIGCLGVRTWLPVRERSALRPKGRKSTNGPTSSVSPTGRVGSGRRMPTESVVLARELVASGRLPWLATAPRYLVASTLRRFSGWGVADVVAQAERHIRERHVTVPDRVAQPAGYLRWLLSTADPAVPPAKARRADVVLVAAAASERARAARAESDRIRSQAAPRGPGAAAARQIAARATARSVGRRRYEADQAARERARAAESSRNAPDSLGRLRAASQELAAAAPPAAPCVGCGTSDGVLERATPSLVPLCEQCWTPIRSALDQ